MFKKITLIFVSLACVAGIAAVNVQSDTAYARDAATMAATDPGDNIDVFIQVSGIIQSVQVQSSSVSIVTFTDGTTILVNPATLTSLTLAPGQPITLWGAATDDGNPDFVAKTITLSTPTPVASVTAAATLPPTAAPTLAATLPATLPATMAATNSATCGSGNTQP